MDVVARVRGEPGAHLGMFMSSVVVDDQMHLQVSRDVAVNMPQKRQELLMAMPRLALRDDLTGGHIECRKQGRGAVALVVMRTPST